MSISLKNGGGIRDSIGAVLGYGGGAEYVPPLANPSVGKEFGQISRLDIENALRFNNGLALVTLTAQQLRDTLEWGVAAVAPGATPGQFPHLGGLWFGFAPANPPMTYTRATDGTITGVATPGSRLRTLVAARDDGSLDLVVDHGVLVGDPLRTFRMITLDFLAGGGDSYFPLTQGKDRKDLVAAGTSKDFATPGAEQWALASYLTNLQAYAESDALAPGDQRTQNLGVRSDTVTAPLLTRIVPGSGVEVTFTTLKGKRYEVLAGETLDGPWTTLTRSPLAGTGFLLTTVHIGGPASHRFYRVRHLD